MIEAEAAMAEELVDVSKPAATIHQGSFGTEKFTIQN